MLQNGKKTIFPYECSNLLLGRGGSGAVFLARDIESKAYVAVKRTYNKPKPGCGEPQIQLEPSQLPLFSRKQSNSLEDMASFTNGAHFNLFSANNQAASSVQPEEWEILEHIGFHPHIVSCLGHHTSTRNVTYFAMELMNSDAAREVTKGNEYIKQEQVYSGIAFSILEALAFIHDKGIVHGDIKPGNILFKSVSREKIGSKAVILHEEADNSFTKTYLGDFSVSRFVNVTASTGARGTLYYKPPEQLLGGQIRNSTACDMWSFGCALLEIVMGALTFSGDNEFQVCMNILSSLGVVLKTTLCKIRIIRS
ncbi:protein kinase [Angomonas deanei]|uniref:Protein kinase domain/Protein tyrosine kinase, putative n=1 Tax=Angomonas deanei TaxID=59799 RepID=A0A7G2CLH8_9TRYP|nr:protein kinase [Angomonas deanei]CAD2219917.1 Protein kinase domain/Protein tyrosine kinase, putative [Angomonas deanei]|eukprot:EPY22311.1 protein kinase [Angomonas deanei]